MSTYSIETVHEFINEAGDGQLILAAANAIYKDGIDFWLSSSDITPPAAPTANHWQFLNFNGKCIGVQRNHGVITYDGASDFAPLTVASGSAPVGGDCGTAAFGRLWILDGDEQTIRYSALLDETLWDEADGGGFIDMSSVWTQGRDRVRAIKALGANLVVFGENHIIMWADDQGSSIGIDPTRMYVVDTIEGTGCIARDSVVAIGEGDMAYLSRHGVQLLGRTIINRVNPVEAASANVKTELRDLVAAQQQEDPFMAQVRGVFHPEESFYVLNLPVVETMLVFDTRTLLPGANGGSVMRVTTWEVGGDIRGICSTQGGELIFGSDGVIGKYTGTNDNGDAYPVTITTGWLDMGELNNRLKILKVINTIVRVTGDSTFDYSWAWDFEGEATDTVTIEFDGFGGAEYGIGEYGIAEYSGNLQIRRKRMPGQGTGQFIQLSIDTDVSGFNFILQQVQLTSKIGRLAV